MTSGRPNVGAATSEPCGCETSSFSVSAERLTISRQRPWYLLRADPVPPEVHRMLEALGYEIMRVA